MASAHGWREAAVSATSVASDVVVYLGVSLRLGCATVDQALSVARNAAPQVDDLYEDLVAVTTMCRSKRWRNQELFSFVGLHGARIAAEQAGTVAPGASSPPGARGGPGGGRGGGGGGGGGGGAGDGGGAAVERLKRVTESDARRVNRFNTVSERSLRAALTSLCRAPSQAQAQARVGDFGDGRPHSATVGGHPVGGQSELGKTTEERTNAYRARIEAQLKEREVEREAERGAEREAERETGRDVGRGGRDSVRDDDFPFPGSDDDLDRIERELAREVSACCQRSMDVGSWDITHHHHHHHQRPLATTNDQRPTINHQPPTTNHQPPTTNHHTNDQPPPITLRRICVGYSYR